MDFSSAAGSILGSRASAFSLASEARAGFGTAPVVVGPSVSKAVAGGPASGTHTGFGCGVGNRSAVRGSAGDFSTAEVFSAEDLSGAG